MTSFAKSEKSKGLEVDAEILKNIIEAQREIREGRLDEGRRILRESQNVEFCRNKIEANSNQIEKLNSALSLIDIEINRLKKEIESCEKMGFFEWILHRPWIKKQKVTALEKLKTELLTPITKLKKFNFYLHTFIYNYHNNLINESINEQLKRKINRNVRLNKERSILHTVKMSFWDNPLYKGMLFKYSRTHLFITNLVNFEKEDKPFNQNDFYDKLNNEIKSRKSIFSF
jgi:hypothetical protein